jgi:hypothetical protein
MIYAKLFIQPIPQHGQMRQSKRWNTPRWRINGHNLGRFWKNGPQQTLYVPGPWLKRGSNELLVLDVDGPEKTSGSGLRAPVLDKIKPDAALLHRAPGQAMDLSAETPVHSGTLTNAAGWKEVTFSTPASGRYLCFEALRAKAGGCHCGTGRTGAQGRKWSASFHAPLESYLRKQ